MGFVFYIDSFSFFANKSFSSSSTNSLVSLISLILQGEREIDCLVSVKMDSEGNTRVVSPCGLCRYTFEKLELNCDIILEDVDNGTILKVNCNQLLPYPYKREAKIKADK